MSCEPFLHQAVELLELARAVDDTQRVIQLGIFRLNSGECRAGMLSRRGLFFRPIPTDLVPDTAKARASHASARASLYEHASASVFLERVPLPKVAPPHPWLPPQDATTGAAIAHLEAKLDFERASESSTLAFEGLGRRFLVTVIPGHDADLACLLERSVRANDAGDAAIHLAHVCRATVLETSLAQLRAYASSIGAVPIGLR